jgi:hypothetical protein
MKCICGCGAEVIGAAQKRYASVECKRRSANLRRNARRESRRPAPCPPEKPHWRPACRGECPLERPCPFVGCRHNLFLDVRQATGNIQFNWPGLEPDEIPETCSLDVAARGPLELERVGVLLGGISREAVRQIEEKAMAKFQARFIRDGGEPPWST